MNPIVALTSLPGFARLSAAVLMLGTATSFAFPYLSLFGANEVHMSPLALGAFMTSLSVSSILMSAWLGRRSDRLASRKPVVLLAALAGTAGYGLMAYTRLYGPLVLIACVFLGLAAAAFPQLFAFAKAQLGSADARASEHGGTALRSVFSVAWVVGPAAGATILARAGFTGLFLGSAAAYALAAVCVLGVRPAAPTGLAPAPRACPAGDGLDRPIWPVSLCFVLYGMANSMGAISLPIHVTRALHGSSGDVGFLVGLCALLEVPVMLSFVLLRRRPSNEGLIILAFALFAVYFLLVASAAGLGLLVLAQAVRATVIAVTATLGMAYFQELMPQRVGAAITLFSNTTSAGQMLAGLAVGAVAQTLGYRAVFVLCAAVTGLACLLLVSLSRAGTRRALRGPGALSSRA